MSQLFVDDVVSKEGTNSVGFSKGISVSVASTFSGDVSIGGTLTYEDVTNIDVVGLITARNGLKIGAAGIGGTIAANGNTTLAGVVTATSFSGAATGLTGVPGGQITGALAAVDGSALTGMANTANVNTADLRVVGVATIGVGLTLADDVEARFGNAGDLRIYHDGSTNIIDAATSNALSFRRGGSEQFFVGASEFKGGDDKKIKLGTGDDLQIYFDGTQGLIEGTAPLYIKGSNVIIYKGGTTEKMLQCNGDGATSIWYDGSKKLETTGYGVTLSGGACLSGLTTAFGGLTVAGTMVESMSSTTTAYNTSGDLNITNGNFHFNSANLGGTGTTLNIMSTAGINTTTKVNQVLNVTAVTAVNATTAFVNKVTIDGKATGITTHWVGGSVPSDGGGSGVDTYSFNILKTGSETYIIVANQVKTS